MVSAGPSVRGAGGTNDPCAAAEREEEDLQVPRAVVDVGVQVPDRRDLIAEAVLDVFCGARDRRC